MILATALLHLPALPLFKMFAASCRSNFLLFPPWYEYMHVDGSCNVIFNSAPNGTAPTPGDFFGVAVLIGLAIIDILLRVAGLVAVGFVVYGGIQYVTSQGEPDKTAKAQGTVINALIGLAITIVAIPLVSFVGNRLSK